MEIKDKKSQFFHWIIFLLFPFLSAIIAVKNYRWKWSKDIVWLFVSFVGFTFVIFNDTMDANVYKNHFLEMTNPNYSFQTLINGVYTIKAGGKNDIYQPLLSYFVSRFTNNYHIFFAFVGLVFGYFFSRNLWYLLKRLERPVTLLLFLLLAIFVFTNPFWRIQSVRFWTTTQIFFFGALPYIYENKKKYIWICLLTPLFHWAYFVGIAILFLYKIFGNKIRVYYCFLLISLFISSVNLKKVETFGKNILPSFLTDKVEVYTDTGYQEEVNERYQKISVLNSIYRYSLDFFIILFVSLLFTTNFNQLKKNPQLFNLFNLAVLFLAFGYLFTNITSLARFLDLAKMFFFAMLILCLQDPLIYSKCRKPLNACLPILIMLCIAPLRIGFNYLSVMTLGGNPFFFFFGRIEVTINQLIGLSSK